MELRAGFSHQAPQLLPGQSRQAPSRSRSAQAAAMLRNTTALRASAREFVPGSLKAAPPAPQPGEPFLSAAAALPLDPPRCCNCCGQERLWGDLSFSRCCWSGSVNGNLETDSVLMILCDVQCMGPRDVTPSEELVAIAAAAAAAAAAHTTQMSQGHQSQAGQLNQQPSIASLQQDGKVRPGQSDVDAVSKLSKMQPAQVRSRCAAQHAFC